MKIFHSPKHKLHDPSGLIIGGLPFITEEVIERPEIILHALLAANLGTMEAPRDFGLEPIRKVHDPLFINYQQDIYTQYAASTGTPSPIIPETFAPRAALRRPKGPLGLPGYYAFGVGSPILEGTWEAAYWSAQCALSAAASVREGASSSYALCRPPGHHAGRCFYGGFCYLNNAAIAARYLGERIAILDIDYHHGNGTQDIFYQDPSVLFCSLHANPDNDYPYYWGEASETGIGPGLGFNRNWPLPPGTDDRLYLQSLQQALDIILNYQPIALVVSLGFDIVPGDPAGGFCISPSGLHQIGKIIFRLNVPTVIIQEGGYHLQSLGDNVISFFSGFTG